MYFKKISLYLVKNCNLPQASVENIFCVKFESKDGLLLDYLFGDYSKINIGFRVTRVYIKIVLLFFDHLFCWLCGKFYITKRVNAALCLC